VQQQSGIISQLPLPLLAHLTELQVDGNSLQLAPSSSSPGCLQHASSIQRLKLMNCSAMDGQHGLSTIPAALPALQDLTLRSWQRNREEGLKIPSEFLPTLTRLTRLHLDADLRVCHGRQQLGCLTNLNHLHLGGFYYGDAIDWEGLQQLQQLTSLSFWQVDLAASWAAASGLSLLTGLQQLGLEDSDINLAVLQSITWLKQLRLDNAEVVKEPHKSGLFAWISKQHALTHLEVLCVCKPARVLQTGASLSLGRHMHDLRLQLWIDCGA
jgi:hypothetical protein